MEANKLLNQVQVRIADLENLLVNPPYAPSKPLQVAIDKLSPSRRDGFETLRDFYEDGRIKWAKRALKELKPHRDEYITESTRQVRGGHVHVGESRGRNSFYLRLIHTLDWSDRYMGHDESFYQHLLTDIY